MSSHNFKEKTETPFFDSLFGGTPKPAGETGADFLSALVGGNPVPSPSTSTGNSLSSLLYGLSAPTRRDTPRLTPPPSLASAVSPGALSSLASYLAATPVSSGGSPFRLDPIPAPPLRPIFPVRTKKASIKTDLQAEVAKVFRERWTTRDGNVVPTDEGITLDNDAVKLDATVLYADLADSTNLVDSYQASFAAEIYKTFLHCAAKIVRSEGGEITAYDGDRIMAVYVGRSKNTSAVRSALKINYAVQQVIGPAVRSQYSGTTFELLHKIGVDTSALFIAKTGVRGANDLVWVGRSANYAAKLSALDNTYRTYITQQVYDALDPSVKDKKSQDGQPMWEPRLWTAFDSRLIYASNWWFELQ